MAISLQRVIRSTSCLVMGWNFRGRRIKRRYLRFEQVQDGGRRHVGKMSNGHNPQPVVRSTSCFVVGWGFRGRRIADLMALFSIRTNSRWRPPPSCIILNRHISATAHELLSGHLCDSAAFLYFDGFSHSKNVHEYSVSQQMISEMFCKFPTTAENF